ncbi:hypothetical protein ACK3SF_00710 [Candidatus Nanosalina sp. VS9-1]|uniref:hypothetical protein n=1 Tax=Candidatus Nanosalina sp. VS9-1 TaxID=3388566 RepID=UPI0039E031BE
MGILPSVFGSSGNSGNNDVEKKSRTNSTPGTVDGSKSNELRSIMSGDNIDMTDRDVKLSADHTSSHLNVAKSPLLERMNHAVGKVEREKSTIVNKLPASEADKMGRELQAAEDDSAQIVKADINPHEKMVVSGEVLNEASEAIKERVKKMFELKAEIGDRDEDEIREDMKELWRDVYRLVDQNMQAYYFIHDKAANESREVQAFTVDAANVFRNTVKVWSKLNRDAAGEIQSLKKWRMKRVNFDSGNDTIFQQFFA